MGTGDWGMGNSGPPLGIRGNGEWGMGKGKKSFIPIRLKSMLRGTASTIFWHIKYLTGAVPLQRIYLSQTLFELV
ncbi:sphingomyelin phosphodiesterase 1, acid lysosomal [Tolypothrix sp. PCC 7601]|nr:sphingomyelin phosphodiesterase 1, acid lysosomal [Tolypothrix sp. PCC 7601]